MIRLHLSFFGAFQASLDGKPITSFEADKVRALLAYLAVEADRPHRRDALTGLLWSDWPDRSARTSLRNALANLRGAIDDRNALPPFLHITRETIQFNQDSSYWLDVAEFNRLIESQDDQNLEEAIELYQGSFLEGFQLKENAAFEEWHLLTRERLQRSASSALQRLAENYQIRSEFDKASEFAWQLVELEPWHEEGHQQLMRLLALSGQRSAALAQFDACQQQLAHELGVEPSPETVRLYEQIRDGEFIQPEAISTFDLPPAPGESPYKGLQYFDEHDANLFFGRKRVISKLIAQLDPASGNRFLAIVGASGSGKSSIIRAGVIPALRGGDNLSDGFTPPAKSSTWPIFVITPTSQPLEALALGVTESEASLESVTTLIDSFSTDKRSLHLHLRRNMPDSADHLLIVVDQFEELFTQCQDKQQRRIFIDNLMTAVEASGPTIVIIGLRADFYAHCGEYQLLREALERQQVYIGSMSTEELCQAVTEPARFGEWTFEPGLVDLMLKDVENEPGALPLLSHALLETWKRRRGRILNLAGYIESGGVRGAIAQTAEQVLNRMEPDQQRIARNIFLRLTELGEATQETRRRARLSELLQGPGDAASIEYVLKTLVDARLIITSHDSAEVAHEALIREWPTLREWLVEGQEGLRIQRHLTEAAQEWLRLQHDRGELYRGARLATAREWAAGHTSELNTLEQEFLATSEKLAREKERARDEQRQRELAAAQKEAQVERKHAEEQTQAAQRLRNRALLLAVLTALSIFLVIYAFITRNDAIHEAQLNRSLVLAELAVEADQAGSVDQALALGLQAISMEDPPTEAVRKLADVAGGMGTRAVLSAGSGAVLAADFSPDARQAIFARCLEANKEGDCSSSELILWDLSTLAEITRWRVDAKTLTKLVWRPESQQTLTSSADGELILWDTNNQEVINSWRPQIGSISALDISPDGVMAAVGGHEGAAVLINLDLEEITHLEGHTGQINEIKFSPDGKHIASASADSSIIVWDVAQEEAIFTIDGHISSVTGIAYLPDGERFLSASLDFTHRLWDASTGEELMMRRWGDTPQGVALSPDGKTVVHYDDNIITTWDLEAIDAAHQKLLGHEGNILDLTISQDGSLALSADEEGILRIWNLHGNEQVQQVETGIAATSVDLSSDGKTVAIAGFEESGIVWDLESSQPQYQLTGLKSQVPGGGLAFSSDGLWLAAATGDYEQDIEEAKLFVWQANSGEMHCDLEGHNRRVRTLAFSPNGKQLLSGSMGIDASGDLILWNIEDCFLVDRLDIEQDTSAIDFSDDGIYAVTSSAFHENTTLWNLETKQAEQIFDLPGEIFLYTIFGPRDETVIASSVTGTIVQWDRDSGAEVKRFTGHDGGVWSLALNPDETKMTSSDDTGLVILWDLATGSELSRHNYHRGPAFQAIFSHDGGTIYSVSVDRTLASWQIGDLSLPALLAWIENNRYVRELTCEERETFQIEPYCQKP